MVFKIIHILSLFNKSNYYKDKSVLNTIKKELLLKYNFDKINKNLSNSNISINNYNNNNINDYPDLRYEIKLIKKKQRKVYLDTKLLKITNFLKYLNIKNILDFRNSKEYVHKLFIFISKHIGTYKSSVHELVEGQREVIHNDEFIFDDGESVKNKIDKFELKFKQNFSLKESNNNSKMNRST